MIDKFANFRRIILMYDFVSELGLKDKYFDRFLEVQYDFLLSGKKNSTSLLSRSILFNLLIVVFSAFGSLCYYKCKLSRHSNVTKQEIDDSEVIALPFMHKIVRYKQFFSCTRNDSVIIYPPIIHYDYSAEHIEAFKNKRVKYTTFGLRNILKTIAILFSNYPQIKKCDKEIKELFEFDDSRFSRSFALSLLYSVYFRFLLSSISNKPKIWILDYDYDLKYIIYNSLIHTQKSTDITVHLQHGAFWSKNNVYCNVVSDYTLCCSRREAEMIINCNRYGTKVVSLGAPMQSFIDDDYVGESEVKFDVCVLLTETLQPEWLLLQTKVLDYLVRDCNYLRVLLRFRPASKDQDIRNLSKYSSLYTVSCGTSLREDILSSKVVISFSEDASYDVIRNNRALFLCTPSVVGYKLIDIDKLGDIPIILINEDNVEMMDIDSYLKLNNSVYKNDEFILSNFGIVDFDHYKESLSSFLLNLYDSIS